MAVDRMIAAAVAQSFVLDTPEELAAAAADWIVERGVAALAAPPRRGGDGEASFALCLSGGTTPRRVYELLGEQPRRDRIRWERAHIFWGDERVVASDDPRSNFRMAWEALLRHVAVPPGNIHPIPTERMTAAAGAAAYETVLKRFYGASTLEAARPLFDVTLLGLGEDGHLASLFPNAPALAETRRWVVPVVGAGPLDRISLTFPALAASAAIAFLVAGAKKSDALARVRAGDETLPATRLKSAGSIVWFADRAAATTPAFSGE